MRKNKRPFIHYLPIYGCFSTGLIYLGIGVIAILSFLRIKDGGADEGALLAFLNDSFIGKVFFWIILIGIICYVIWRGFETIKDPYGYGKDFRGIARRTGIAMSTIPDILIALTAFRILAGVGDIRVDGQPVSERAMAGNMLQETWGEWALIGIGVIICLTALVQFFYGITRGYKERLDMAHFKVFTKNVIHFLAWVGYLARGVIVGIIGFFLVKAGASDSADVVVNTDKAFDFIGDHVGHLYFILIAIGTICYGLFMFAHGIAHDADKD